MFYTFTMNFSYRNNITDVYNNINAIDSVYKYGISLLPVALLRIVVYSRSNDYCNSDAFFYNETFKSLFN